MYDDNLPGPSLPGRRPSPVKKVVGHITYQLRHPSRTRKRVLLVLVALTGFLLLHLGRRHMVDIQRNALSLTSYVPSQITAAFGHDVEIDSLPWHHGQDLKLKNESISIRDPAFRLLIPVSKPSLNLCKTLLSAAILNYPPPTLLGYGQDETRDGLGEDVVHNILKLFNGKDSDEDDLVLIVDEDTLFQLPAEILISRFFHSIRDSTFTLLEKHGRYAGNFTTLPSQRPQQYYSHIIFGAQKKCTSSPLSPACFFAPPPPLLRDRHDTYNRYPNQHNRPRFLASQTVMGTIGHLRPLYAHANELLETDMKSNETQQIFLQIFGVQEYSRELHHQSTLGIISKASQWLSSKLGTSKHQFHLLDHSNMPTNPNSSEISNCEFGIALDYTSSLFQIIDSRSEDDIRFLKFANLSDSLKLPSTSIQKIHLPHNLNTTAPFELQESLLATNDLPKSTKWFNISLATNTLNPTSPIIPSLLHLTPPTNLSFPLWYQPHARALLHRSIHAPSTPILVTIPPSLRLEPIKLHAKSQPNREISYTDLRGGRGGVWTDKGEWLAWNEVCGSFDKELFGDGDGVFGREGGDAGAGGRNRGL